MSGPDRHPSQRSERESAHCRRRPLGDRRVPCPALAAWPRQRPGNGFPSPYSSTLNPYKVDGFGLNDPLNLSDNAHLYYGESYIKSSVKLAPNAVVFMSHACYAQGSSESWDVDPTVSVAEQRVHNFAAGFIGAGARAVFALAHDDPSPYVAKILTGTTLTMKSLFETGAGWTGTW